MSKDDYDYKVVCETELLWAIQPIKKRTYSSYAFVAAGLTKNPTEIPVVEPISWYVKEELLTQFRIKPLKEGKPIYPADDPHN